MDGTVASNGQTIVIHKSGILEITDINGANPITLDVPGNTSVIVFNGTPNYFETASPAVTRLVQQSLPPPETSAEQEEEVEDEQVQDEVETEPEAIDEPSSETDTDADDTTSDTGQDGEDTEEAAE